MKKLIVALAVFFLMTGAVYAGVKDNCGCGIGSQVFYDKDSLLFQVLAATTNGICGNQTFGISSGTLGCDKPKNLVKTEELNKFVAENMDNLAIDIASGEGESLNSVAEIIEVPADRRPEFFSALQNNFGKIYSSANVSHTDVVDGIVSVARQI